uniref:NADH-ubiquinone oxidoreductase chain 6 n=1 Tax=Pentacheles validus TaxID=2508670 RepID=A0A410RF90_9EUCA|nr:NADH dehydrogenase subunit 6 [Pentacheles validus]QAT80329.1 NADH dehydrogenase subunit 6 [Pentacheles validus]
MNKLFSGILTIFLPLTLISSLLFLFLKHPLSMGLTLLFQTVFICMTSGVKMTSYWFSYILFLIFLGGLLVLFIYVTSLASNEKLNFSVPLSLLGGGFFLSFNLIFLILDPLLTSFKINYLASSLIFKEGVQQTIAAIYNTSSMLFTLFLVFYLLLCLLVVVKISNLHLGPLRLSK